MTSSALAGADRVTASSASHMFERTNAITGSYAREITRAGRLAAQEIQRKDIGDSLFRTYSPVITISPRKQEGMYGRIRK